MAFGTPRSSSLAIAFLFVSLFTIGGCGGSGKAEEPFSKEVVDAADAKLKDWVNTGKASGVMVQVTTPKGTWSSTYGVADQVTGAPMQLPLQIRIGSVTKTFTTTLALLLVRDGKIGLDDPVSKYLPDVPNGNEITIRMLGDMTAGLSEYLANPKIWDTYWPNPEHVFKPKQLLEYSYELGPAFAPGTSSDYSNANTVLLGLVIEKVEGKRFGQVLKERILVPYGLNQTEWPTGTTFSEAHVHGYTEKPGAPNTDSTYFSPSFGSFAGQMISSVPDLTRWAKLLGSGAIVGPALQAERLKWKPIGQNTLEWHYTFGIEAGSWLGHNGQIPGYQDYAVYNPDLDATIVMTVNSDRLVDGEPGMNLLLTDVSKILFPDNPVFVPKVGG